MSTNTTQLVCFLVDSHAKLDISTISGGNYATHYAGATGNARALMFLLERGCPMKRNNRGYTPIDKLIAELKQHYGRPRTIGQLARAIDLTCKSKLHDDSIQLELKAQKESLAKRRTSEDISNLNVVFE
jgi:hypothetical protein